MISVLRKIRKKLIAEGNLTRYLLYAIGEILLVVIGILLALQINNWNQTKNDGHLEQDYLVRLQYEISKDTTDFKDAIERIQMRNQIIEDFTDALNNANSSDSLLEVKAHAFFEQGWITLNFVYSRNTFSDLSSTGRLKIISDVALRERLIAYYAKLVEQSNGAAQNETWINSVDVVFTTGTSGLSLAPRTKHLFGDASRLLDLETNKELYLRVAAAHFWANATAVFWYNDSIKSAEVLLSEIEKEII